MFGKFLGPTRMDAGLLIDFDFMVPMAVQKLWLYGNVGVTTIWDRLFGGGFLEILGLVLGNYRLCGPLAVLARWERKNLDWLERG